jgi:hypothetical protein
LFHLDLPLVGKNHHSRLYLPSPIDTVKLTVSS